MLAAKRTLAQGPLRVDYRSSRVSAAKNSGLIAIDKAIMRPRAKPISVPAATPRQSIFSSPFVIFALRGVPRPLPGRRGLF